MEWLWKILRKKLLIEKNDDLGEIYQIPKFMSAEQVLRLTNKGWYIGKRRIPPEEVAALKQEATNFKNSFLWRLMRRDIHYQAYLQATAKRKTDADAFYAGAMYKDLEVIEEFIERCESLR